jgi:signal transduction histidine kinase
MRGGPCAFLRVQPAKRGRCDLSAAYHQLMGPKLSGPRWGRAPGSSGAAAGAAITPGPALTTLRAAATRTASIIRCVGIVCTAAQVIIWHSYYLAAPWRLAGPVTAVTWGIVAVAYLLRRWPRWQFAALDSGVYVLLALCARWYVPPVLRGSSASWLYIMLIGQLVAPAWFTPAKVLAVLTLASVAAYWTGAVITPSAGSGSALPATACVLLLAVASAAWFGRRMLYRRAIAADNALARADRDARDQYVLLSRHTERREHERLLHDTVLNTLTALARGGGSAGDVVRRCREDVRLIEVALADPGDAAGEAAWPSGGLLTMIEEVAGQLRSRGLDVHVAVKGDAATPDGPVSAMETRVARALAHAVREALVNVASHAGTSEAWVEVSLGAEGGLLVTVRDAGVGFDPDRVTTGRLGLRRSIIERVAEHGGQVSIGSAPGEGTVVCLRWAPPPHPPDGVLTDDALAESPRTAGATLGGISGRDGPRW